MSEPKSKHEEGYSPPPKPHHSEIPPHILRELLELRKRVGNLEVMMEMLLRQREKDERKQKLMKLFAG